MRPQERRLVYDGWREGNDGLWRNDRFGGAYKLENAWKRLMSQHGEATDRAEREAQWQREAKLRRGMGR